MESQQKDVVEAARKFEEATGSIPDVSLPIANQLDIAVSSIKQHIKTIIVTRAECKRMEGIHEEYKDKLRRQVGWMVCSEAGTLAQYEKTLFS